MIVLRALARAKWQSKFLEGHIGCLGKRQSGPLSTTTSGEYALEALSPRATALIVLGPG